jgi:hypothetical protein
MPEEQPTHDDTVTAEQLPRRPRRRLLTPIPLVMIGVLLTAAGFIGGVLVEKGQGTSGSSSGAASSSFASRLATLRGALGAGAGSAGAGGPSGAGAGQPVSGQVAYLSGGTLYLTSSEGNTIRVLTSRATSVSKTVTASVKGIHPGETVTVTGRAGGNGALSAESIRVGAGAGALAGLLGGTGSGSGTRAGGANGGGGPTLFGQGG